MRAARVALRSRANPALDLPSPVCVHRLNQYLGAYDAGLRDALVDGSSHGFRIPSYINRSAVSITGYTNHSSACVHANFVSTKLDHELALGRVAGPFARPTPPNLIISPLGVVPKKTPGEYRLIHDLSFPKITVLTRTFLRLIQRSNMNCLTIVSPSFAPWDQIALLQRRTSRMLSGLSLFILTTMVFWVSLGKINFIMTSVSPWAVALPARLLNLSPLLCSGFSHLH